MGNVCQGTAEEVSASLDQCDKISLELVIIIVSIQAVITLMPTGYILFKIDKKKVPRFVWVQIVSLNIYWVLFLTYYILIAVDARDLSRTRQNLQGRDNAIATFGDAAFLIHAWAVTEPILSAALTLPIAANAISDQQECELQKKRKQKTLLYSRVAFVTLTIGWAIASWATGDYSVRMLVDVFFCVIIAIYVTSLLKIKTFVKKADLKTLAKPNRALFQLNLIAQVSVVANFGVLLILSFFGTYRNYDEEDDS